MVVTGRKTDGLVHSAYFLKVAICIGKRAMHGMKGLNRRGKPCAITMV